MFHPVHLILILCILCLLVSPAAFADELPSFGDSIDSTKVVTLPSDSSEAPSADTLPSDAPSDPTEPSVIYVTEAPTEPVYLDVIERSTNSVFHATLFGAFLICGTLVGLHLLRGRYGT